MDGHSDMEETETGCPLFSSDKNHKAQETDGHLADTLMSSQESGYSSLIGPPSLTNSDSSQDDKDQMLFSMDDHSTSPEFYTTCHQNSEENKSQKNFPSSFDTPAKFSANMCCEENCEVTSIQHTGSRFKLPREESSDLIEERQPSVDEEYLDKLQHVDSLEYMDSTSQLLDDSQHQATSQCQCFTEVKHLTPIELDEWRRFTVGSGTSGHFIQYSSPDFEKHFKIQSGDKLVEVGSKDAHGITHEDVVQKLYSTFFQDETYKSTLVIERHSHYDDNEYIQIQYLQVHLNLVGVEEDGVWLNWFNRFHIIKNVEVKDTRKCWISHYRDGSQKYLCPSEEKQGMLTLEPLTRDDDPKYQFQMSLYKGFRVNQNGHKERVYICMLLSKETDMDISAKSKSTVELLHYEDRPCNINHIASPLPQFFIIELGSDEQYTFESLQYEDYFLRWNRSKGIIDLEKCKIETKDALPPEMKFKMRT